MKKILFVLAGLAFALPAQAVMILQLNVPQLLSFSEKVFTGKCVSVTEETDSAGRTIQNVTFEVGEVFKGEKTDRVSFRQMAPTSDTRQMGPVTIVGLEDYVAEFPQYKVGEESLIFLGEASSIGLAAPVGLGQGRFQIIQNDRGEKVILNSKGNKGLFLGLQSGGAMKSLILNSKEKALMRVNGGELPYTDFVSVLKKLVQS